MVTMSLHRDLSPEGILCVTVHPCWVQGEVVGPDSKISDCVQGLLKVMSEAKDEQGGNFLTYKGNILPWWYERMMTYNPPGKRHNDTGIITINEWRRSFIQYWRQCYVIC